MSPPLLAAAAAPVRLNWGCGAHLAGGWINSDLKDEPGVDMVADIRRGLPLEDGSVDCAASVHALPELAYPELVPALRELLRVLRPGGALRLVLPDFERAMAAHREGEEAFFQVPPEEARSAGGRFLVHALWFGYTRTLFTADFAAELLERAGFERVTLCSYRRTASPFGGIVALDNRPRESMYLEGRRPRAGRGSARFVPYDPGVAAQGLEIVDVMPDPGERVRGGFSARDRDGGKLEIVGWALGRDAAVREVEVTADGELAATGAIGLERPDVAEQLPGEPGAATSGFRLELQAEGEGEGQLEVFAVLDDDSREPLGRILVRT